MRSWISEKRALALREISCWAVLKVEVRNCLRGGSVGDDGSGMMRVRELIIAIGGGYVTGGGGVTNG